MRSIIFDLPKVEIKRETPVDIFSAEEPDDAAKKVSIQRAIPLRNYQTNEVFYDTLHKKADRVRIHIIHNISIIYNSMVRNIIL